MDLAKVHLTVFHWRFWTLFFFLPLCFLPPSQHSLENFGGGSKARVPSLDCQSEQKWEVLLLHQHHHVELLREVKLHVRLLNLCSWWSQGRWSGSLDMMQKGIVDPHIHDDVNDMMSITLQRKLIGTISNITVRLLLRLVCPCSRWSFPP